MDFASAPPQKNPSNVKPKQRKVSTTKVKKKIQHLQHLHKHPHCTSKTDLAEHPGYTGQK